MPRLFRPPIHFVSINMPYLFRASQPSSLSFSRSICRLTPRQSSSRKTLGSTRKMRSPLSSSQTYPAGLEGAYPSCPQESSLRKRVSACFWKKVLIRSRAFSISISPIPPRSLIHAEKPNWTVRTDRLFVAKCGLVARLESCSTPLTERAAGGI